MNTMAIKEINELVPGDFIMVRYGYGHTLFYVESVCDRGIKLNRTRWTCGAGIWASRRFIRDRRGYYINKGKKKHKLVRFLTGWLGLIHEYHLPNTTENKEKIQKVYAFTRTYL